MRSTGRKPVRGHLGRARARAVAREFTRDTDCPSSRRRVIRVRGTTEAMMANHDGDIDPGTRSYLRALLREYGRTRSVGRNAALP